MDAPKRNLGFWFDAIFSMNSSQNLAMRRNSRSEPASVLLSHFAFWFGVIFATPVFVAAHNPGDLALPFNVIVGSLAVVCVLMTGLSFLLANLAGARWQWWLVRVLLTVALVSAIEGNLVSDRFYYGAFNGEAPLFRSYGVMFHIEWLTYLLAIALVLYWLFRTRKIPLWLPLLPVASFTFLLLPLLVFPSAVSGEQGGSQEIDPSVFAFSSVGNLIHLLPDGLQGDVVREVFEKNPELADKFVGFTLFTNHLGLYQGTAPAMYTLLTGEPFDLENGHDARRVKDKLKTKSYQKALHDLNYQLDYIPIGGYICPEYASSCYPRPFNDMKARGYFRHHTEDAVYSFRLIADLSLFRLVPMILKEKIYDNGHWLMSDTTMDGSSPWPDPVIHEWVERMNIVDDRPVYKWYHFIGGHIPPHWDANCDYLRDPVKSRENYMAQTYCVLSDIGTLIERLQKAGIYNQTAMIISSDHGHNTIPYDLVAPPLNGGLYRAAMGSGRPTLLIKQKNDVHALRFSAAPTSLVDVAPTALTLAGVEAEQPDVYSFTGSERRERYYTPYSIPKLWTGDPIPFVRYRVDGPVNDGSEWLLTDIQPFAQAPEAYDSVNYATSYAFLLGASLDRNKPNNEASWISGRQLAFLLRVKALPDSPVLQLTVYLPDWIDSQDFTLSVNGQSSGQNYHVENEPVKWQTIEVPLEFARLVDGNNFFDLVFRQTYHAPDEYDWDTAGLLKSIRIINQPVEEPGRF